MAEIMDARSITLSNPAAADLQNSCPGQGLTY
jgi:hypothetical protein